MAAGQVVTFQKVQILQGHRTGQGIAHKGGTMHEHSSFSLGKGMANVGVVRVAART